jgi:hypothetical protein
LLAKNDDAVDLIHRSVCIAGKPRSNRFGGHLLEPSLLLREARGPSLAQVLLGRDNRQDVRATPTTY